MKSVIILLIIFVSITDIQAQGVGNLFSQSEADLKYMLAQIAALQVYMGDAEKGYAIAQKGLIFIGDLKKEEFDMHNAFFNSLKAVNPAVENYAKSADIISYQLAIINDFKKAIQKISRSGHFSPDEMSYLNTVYSNMSGECGKLLSSLIDLITNNAFQMTDNQRIKRIDVIYTDIKDKYAFTQSFTSEAVLLSAQRQNEENEIEFLKKLH